MLNIVSTRNLKCKKEKKAKVSKLSVAKNLHFIIVLNKQNNLKRELDEKPRKKKSQHIQKYVL